MRNSAELFKNDFNYNKSVHRSATRVTCASEQKLSADVVSRSSSKSQLNHRRGNRSPKCGRRPASSSMDRFNCSDYSQSTRLVHTVYVNTEQSGRKVSQQLMKCWQIGLYILPLTQSTINLLL